MSISNHFACRLTSDVHREFRTICPECGNRTLDVNEAKGVKFCHYCHHGSSLRNERRGSISRRSTIPKPTEPNTAAKQAIQRVWQQSRPIRINDPAHRYLCNRGLDLGDVANLPVSLRYHPDLPYRHDDGLWSHHPAIVVPIFSPCGQMVTLHRTYLTFAGQKAKVPSPKKLMPPIHQGATRCAAIRLWPASETLAVSEGVETGLAVRLMTDLPVWATGSAGGMAGLVLPASVRTVIICADNDLSGVGQRAARSLAKRLLVETRRVKILIPDEPGTDWADAMETIHA